MSHIFFGIRCVGWTEIKSIHGTVIKVTQSVGVIVQTLQMKMLCSASTKLTTQARQEL